MSDNPFGGMFGDIFSMLGQQGPDAWFTTATQLALNIARGEDSDPNPLPIERQRLEELAPLVARHVDSLLRLSRSTRRWSAVNRSAAHDRRPHPVASAHGTDGRELSEHR